MLVTIYDKINFMVNIVSFCAHIWAFIRRISLTHSPISSAAPQLDSAWPGGECMAGFSRILASLLFLVPLNSLI